MLRRAWGAEAAGCTQGGKRVCSGAMGQRPGLTLNMAYMSVTRATSQSRGWLKLEALCQVRSGGGEGEARSEAAANVVRVLDHERDNDAARAAEQDEERHETVEVVQRAVRAQRAALAPRRALLHHEQHARHAGERLSLIHI